MSLITCVLLPLLHVIYSHGRIVYPLCSDLSLSRVLGTTCLNADVMYDRLRLEDRMFSQIFPPSTASATQEQQRTDVATFKEEQSQTRPPAFRLARTTPAKTTATTTNTKAGKAATATIEYQKSPWAERVTPAVAPAPAAAEVTVPITSAAPNPHFQGMVTPSVPPTMSSVAETTGIDLPPSADRKVSDDQHITTTATAAAAAAAANSTLLMTSSSAFTPVPSSVPSSAAADVPASPLDIDTFLAPAATSGSSSSKAKKQLIYNDGGKAPVAITGGSNEEQGRADRQLIEDISGLQVVADTHVDSTAAAAQLHLPGPSAPLPMQPPLDEGAQQSLQSQQQSYHVHPAPRSLPTPSPATSSGTDLCSRYGAVPIEFSFPTPRVEPVPARTGLHLHPRPASRGHGVRTVQQMPAYVLGTSCAWVGEVKSL